MKTNLSTKWSAFGVTVLSAALCTAQPAQAQGSLPITLTDASGKSVTIKDTSRILTMGGAVTETVFALGKGQQVVATDIASFYPAAVNKLPKTGSAYRQINAEGVLALKPTLIITTTDAGPSAAIDQLRAAGVSLLLVPAETTPEGAKAKISMIGKALGLDSKATALNNGIDRDIAKAEAMFSTVKNHPKVAFLYVQDAKMVLLSGSGTSADAVIKLAGGVNAITGAQGYKPVTAEALVAAAPDVIVLPERGMGVLGGMPGLMKVPGVAQTPAAKAGRIIAMDDLFLLGFGPRTGQAVQAFTLKLHPELKK